MAASNATDIRIQISLFGNRKIKRLERELGAEGVLSLIRLWCYCAANEPDGAMIGWSAEDLECASDWTGMRLAFASQCEELELIDPLDGGGFAIHDWAENQPWVATAGERSERNRKNAQKRWSRHDSKLKDASRMQVASESDAKCNAPSLPIPSPSHPSEPFEQTEPKRRSRSETEDPGFLRFWAAYPSKVGKGAARKAWKKARISNGKLDQVLAAVEAQKNSPRWLEGIIPNPSTWLNQERWEDEAPKSADQIEAERHAERIAAMEKRIAEREASRNALR